MKNTNAKPIPSPSIANIKNEKIINQPINENKFIPNLFFNSEIFIKVIIHKNKERE